MELAVMIVGLCTEVILGGMEGYNHYWEAQEFKQNVKKEQIKEEKQKEPKAWIQRGGNVAVEIN